VTAGGTPTVFVAETGGGTGNHLSQPIGIASDSAGNLYVSNVNNGDIVKIAPNATTSIFSHTDTTSWLYSGLALDKSGNLYAAERNNGAVVEITSLGAIQTIATGLFRPQAVAVDQNGTVYSSNGDNTISKITASGSVSTFSSGLSDSLGGGLAVDVDGNVYVSGSSAIY
jgi:serine/threonine-protein kinase